MTPEELAVWLRAWVRDHPGTDLKDEGGRLHLVCGCGADLGISYGPATNPEDAHDFEAAAYFEHQAEDLLGWLSDPVHLRRVVSTPAEASATLAGSGGSAPSSPGADPPVVASPPCRCVEVEGYGMDRTACRADVHRDYCENPVCCRERDHNGGCDERAAL